MVFLWSIWRVLRFFFHKAPRTVHRWHPSTAVVVRFFNCYLYAQAIAAMFIFSCSLLAAIAVALSSWLERSALGDDDGESAPPVATSNTWWPLHRAATVYVYYAVCRILVLLGHIFWRISWESYQDFLTLRQLLLGQRPERLRSWAEGTEGESPVHEKGNSEDTTFHEPCTQENLDPAIDRGADKPSETEQDDVPRRPRLKRQSSPAELHTEDHIIRRRVLLAAPLVVLVCMNLIMFIGQVFCFHGPKDACKDLSLLIPTARLNRCTRFVLFISLLEWLQAWTGLFPHWHIALSTSRCISAKVLTIALEFVLAPLSFMRLSEWLLRPAGTGITRHALFGVLPHHFLDSLLVLLLSAWLLMASMAVLSEDNVRASGFSLRRIADNDQWKRLVRSVESTLVAWQLVHLLRGCLRLGFGQAQSDWILISLIHPFVLCFIWVMTYVMAFSISSGRSLTTICLAWLAVCCGAGVAAWLVCALTGRQDKPLLVAFVTAHLSRQAYHIGRRALRDMKEKGLVSQVDNPQSPASRLLRQGSGAFRWADNLSAGPAQEERRWALSLVLFLLGICTRFAAVLAIITMLGGVQSRAGFVLEDFLSWKPVPGGVEITNMAVSKLTLLKNEAGSAVYSESIMPVNATPSYAICGYRFHGLAMLDYAMLATTAYLTPSAKNDLPALLQSMFGPHKQVAVKPTPNKARKWLEIEIRTCSPPNSTRASDCSSVTVISISGTDPTRIADYGENIRMWTEPVLLQILSVIFPTVRLWPLDTTAELIARVKGVIGFLGIPTYRWHYQEILQHVLQKPAEENVVITGHSLGGGMALVVGALSKRLAVALHPPGVYYSLAKHQSQHKQGGLETFGVLHEAADYTVHQRSVTLKFEGDWIQYFDAHGGLVQTMSCDRSAQGVQLACHTLEGAVCHLLRHCGDLDQRFASCRHDYSVHSTVYQVMWDLWSAVENELRLLLRGFTFSPTRETLNGAAATAACVLTVMGLRHYAS